MKEINDKGNEATAKEKNLLTVLELANEMLERGFEFKMVDLNKSDASDWLIEDKTLIAPFSAIPGLGLNVAKQIVAAREEQEFLSKEDLAKRGKVSGTIIDFMTENHVLDDLPFTQTFSNPTSDGAGCCIYRIMPALSRMISSWSCASWTAA